MGFKVGKDEGGFNGATGTRLEPFDDFRAKSAPRPAKPARMRTL